MSTGHSSDGAEGTGALFDLRAGATGQHELTVTSVEGREAMSRLYRFDVTFATDVDAASLRRDLLGEPAEVSLLSPGPGTYRRIRGIAASLVDLGTRDDRGRTHHTLRLVPRAWLLRRRRTSRIYQDMTVVDVVDRVLGEHHVRRLWKTTRVYPKRAYCVQYQETDHDFVARLLAEDGLFFFFAEHEEASGDEAPWEHRDEVLVIGDGIDAYMPIRGSEGDGPGVVPFRAMAGGLGSEEHVSVFRRVSSVKPGAVRHHDYDFERPMLDLTVTTSGVEAAISGAAGAGAGLAGAAAAAVGDLEGATGTFAGSPDLAGAPARLEFYEHHGDHSNVDDARDRAEIRLQQLRRRAAISKGESDCRRLAPGHTFRLEGHLDPLLDGDNVVTRVVHEGRSPGHSEPGRGDEQVYRCKLECAPARSPFRPAPPRRRLVRAVESAVVVGPDHEAIYTDEYGRIKIQFHWDREGERDERSSCWIRVAHPWAGAGWGFQFIPRVGNEVVVSFLGGDPDRPVVVGSLYNRIHMPPFPLPFARTRSGIRTASTGGGGGNELSFEDDAGNEQIRIHARRDLEEEVERHHTRLVRGSETSAIEADSSLTVKGSRRSTVLRDSDVSVRGNRSVVVGGDQTHVVSGDSIVRQRGDVEIETAGSLRQTVGGSASTRVEGPSRIDAASDMITNVEGEHRLTVGVDGTGNTSTTYVFGQMNLSATGRVAIRADEEITLTCGETSLRLTPEKLEALSRALHLVAGEEVAAAGGKAGLLLRDDVEIAAETVAVFSKGGSLELTDSEARLGASKVKLGQPASAEPKEADAAPDPEKKKVKWRFADANFKPYAGKKYHLLTGGLRFEGQTDGDGVVTAEIPKDARSAEVILWLADYPTGPRRRYSIVIADELPDPTSAQGARIRLHALGYDVGLHSHDPWEALARAVHHFQVDHEKSDGLTVTGELDDATKGAIQRVFGS